MAVGQLNLAIKSDQIHQFFTVDGVMRPNTDPRQFAAALVDYFAGLAAGTYNATVQAYVEDDDGTAAAQTIACTRANAAGDTVTIGTVVFTEATTPSTDPSLGQFARGASDTTCGDNLRDAINAHPRLKGHVTAAATTGTITVTEATKGVQGNQLSLATSDATAFALGAARLASGAVGTTRAAQRCYRYGQ
jgi:hypothetical protein